MRLKSLHIYNFSAKVDDYDTTIEFHGDSGEIKLKLGDELSRQILAVCAEEIVAATKRVAQTMTTEVIDGSAQNLIEGRLA